MTLDEALWEAQREYCRQVIEQTGGNITRAAEIAGRDRRGFYKLLDKLGMSRHREPAAPRLREAAGWRSFVSRPANGER